MTTMAKKETVQRKWYVLDAAGKPLGRTAVTVDKAILTGRKLDEKHYYHHTGWIGNLKDVKYRTLMNERPEFAMELAVKGMLPKNTIGRAAATRLKLYKGAEHNNAAQKPEAWTLD